MVSPVDGRALRGRGVVTLVGCLAVVVLCIPLVIVGSKRHPVLAMVVINSLGLGPSESVYILYTRLLVLGVQI